MRTSGVLFLLSLCCYQLARADEKPVIALTGGWIYVSTEQPQGGRGAFRGWYIIPQYHLNKNLSLIAEFDNLHGSPQGESTNLHAYIAGPLYGRKWGKRLFPFTFAEAGALRASAAGNVTHSFMQLIPADYILTNPPGGPFHNYAAQAGVVFDIWSK